MSTSEGGQLIVCTGAKVSPVCAAAMDSFLKDRPAAACRFVMQEWLHDEQFRTATLLWIMDGSEPWDIVQFTLRNRIPLLVPEDNFAMKEVCRNAGCGMYYGNAAEACLCLHLLVEEAGLRDRMGQSGYLYFKHTSR